MGIKKFWEVSTLKTKVENIFGKAPLKKIIAGLLVSTMFIGGGFCIAKEHHDSQKHAEYTAYIQSQAAERNLTLIDEAKVKNITAQTIGVNESAINFYKIKLKNYQGKYSADFKPVYKVKCFANGVKYELKIDAVSGEVIKDYV